MNWYQSWKARLRVKFWRDWDHVPPPNWGCSRRKLGGNYW